MALTVHCTNPSCGVTFPRSDTDAGRIVSCPSCGQSVPVRAEGDAGKPKERTLGSYRLIRPIAKGGMGEVYEAQHLSLDRRVALKLLPPNLAKDDVFMRRFEREARLAAALNHPNLTKVFDFGIVEGSAFLVMEFIDGEDLSKRVAREGKLPVAEALRLVEDTAGALQEAHRRGIIHRDIKPGNILLTSQGVVKVTDLGLARGMADEATLTATGVAAGTPHFMSPEQARDLHQVDHRADIYSLGITLLYLLTGKRPFDARSSFSILRAHAEEALPTGEALGTKLPDGVEALIRHMAAKTLADRYPDYDSLIQDIQRVRRGESPVGPLKGAPAQADSKTPALPTLKPLQPPTQRGRITIVGSANVKVPAKLRGRPNLLAAFIALAATLAVVLGFLVVRLTRQSGVHPHEQEEPSPQIAATSEATAVSAPKKPGAELWDEQFSGMPRPLIPLYPIKNPLADGTADELWQRAVNYAQENPSHFRTSIAAFEQVQAKAVGTPLARRAQQAISEWTAKRDEAGNRALAEFQAEFWRTLEQSSHPQAMFLWSRFPTELRSDVLDEKVWEFILANARPSAPRGGGPMRWPPPGQ